MTERKLSSIEIVDVFSSFDYCVVPQDKNIKTSLMQLLDIERQLETPDVLSNERWGELSMRHVTIWQELPDYYKGILSDLTAIEAQR